MKVRKTSITFFLLLIGAYVVLFPHGVGKELVVSPKWTTSLPSLPEVSNPTAGSVAVTPIVAAGNTTGPLTAFELGNDFGFIDGAGRIHYLGRKQYGVALGSDRFANYPSLSRRVIVQDPAGATLATIEQAGYPMFLRNQLYLLSPQGDTITAYDSFGKRLWTHQMGSVITAADAAHPYSAVGLLNGQVDVFNNAGASVFQKTPGSSSMPVVLGISLSKSGNRMAIISGIEPQIVTIYDVAAGRFTPTDTRSMRSDFRRPVIIRCIDDSEVTAIETDGGIELIDQKSHGSHTVVLPGTLQSIVEHRIEGLIVAGSLEKSASGEAGTDRTQGVARAAFFLPDGRSVFRLRFPASTLFMHSSANGLIFGAEGALFEIDFSVG